jgi:hypothetical protein
MDSPSLTWITVHIEDGESGEATLVQLRAKLFALDNKEAGWKERGVGTLKINVPKLCASYDENGVPIPGSFDVSGFDCYEEDDDTPKVPRLVKTPTESYSTPSLSKLWNSRTSLRLVPHKSCLPLLKVIKS